MNGVHDPGRVRALASSGLLERRPTARFERLARLAARLLSAPTALVSLVDDTRQHFIACASSTELGSESPLSQSFCALVVDAREPLIVPDARTDPVLSTHPAHTELGVVAYLGVPLHDPDGVILGSFCVLDWVAREWDDEDVAGLTDLAACITAELALTRAVESEREARRAADASREIDEYLARASAVLARSLDLGETLESIARLSVPQLADWCAIDLLDESGQLQRHTLIAHDGVDADAAEVLRQTRPQAVRKGNDLINVLHSGDPAIVECVTDENLEAWSRDEAHGRALRAAGTRSVAVLPLLARGRTMGTMTLVSQTSGRFDTTSLPLLSDLALRAAVAVDNARAYASRDQVARVLQATLLPPRLPQVEGLELAARFHPSGAGLDVGGDFYDVFETGSGPWLAVIGDVCGKGSEAAALTGLARHTIRAAAMGHRSPARMLKTLNDALLSETERQIAEDDPVALAERFCTVVAVRVAMDETGATILVACAGHPFPLVRRADGRVERAGASGDLLGILDDVEVDDVELRLEPGDAIVLVTDGVLEARDAAGDQLDEAGFAAIVEAAPGDATRLAAAVAEAALHRNEGGTTRDDIAVLALSIPAPS